MMGLSPLTRDRAKGTRAGVEFVENRTEAAAAAESLRSHSGQVFRYGRSLTSEWQQGYCWKRPLC
jgi:hypothetical protein